MFRVKHKLAFMIAGIMVVLGMILVSIITSKSVTVIAQNTPIANRNCIVIDAGHGGVDGGAVSCTGILESKINLEIALKLNDLCHLLGLNTKMIRTTDCSVYTQGDTIASKKVSDLKERVRIINDTENGILVSIHQNKYIESRYRGAQIFYGKIKGSDQLAKIIQDGFSSTIDPNSGRKIKKADGVYLLENSRKPSVLVECGFLSNPEDEALLQDPEYQKKIACVIASSCSQFLNMNENSAA